MSRPAPVFMTSMSDTVFDVAQLAYTGLATETVLKQQDDSSTEIPSVDVHILNRNPLQTWIIQVGVIMITTQLLSLLLKRIRQPRVIAEILGGIVLSPSVLGRIPGFTQAVFPSASKAYLALVANIGLVLFMFLIGLEIDGSVIRRNARLSASIALSGMVIPFALGSTLSLALYEEFIDPATKFIHFLLFVGVAFSITAFPVLCRILTELKLLDTTVGVVVISAGVANDVVGWTLLAFSMALAKAASGLTALWVLGGCMGWAVFLLFPVRWTFHWLGHRSGSVNNGPSVFFMTATMLMMFLSALVTDAIGIHAIFGSFLAGLIIPREGGLALALTEKLEDMVSIIFLPLYFTLSGLSTDFSLLNNGITWAYTIGIISIAWVGKFGGCAIAARISGFEWREATTIGTLMSCKGLVELIVLNAGLSAGILNTRIYTMFVLEALLLTFSTTPVVAAIYPPQYRKRAVAGGPDYDGIADQEDSSKDSTSPPYITAIRAGQHESKSPVMVVLDKLEHLPGIITMTQLFRPIVLETSQDNPVNSNRLDSNLEQNGNSPPTVLAGPSTAIQALRLIERSDRTSTIVKSSKADSLIHTDPILNVFKSFCDISDISVSPSFSAGPSGSFATKVIDHALETFSGLVLVSWLPYPNEDNPTPDSQIAETRLTSSANVSPDLGVAGESRSRLHSQLMLDIFSQSSVNVALFVDEGRTGPGHYGHQRVILPFFGGPDDRLALATVVRMCRNPKTTAKILRVAGQNIPIEEHEIQDIVCADVQHGIHSNHSTSTGSSNTARARSQSNAADDAMWQCFVQSSSLHPSATRSALERIQFVEIESTTSLCDVLVRVRRESDTAVQERLRPFIVTGRAQSRAVEIPQSGLLDLETRNIAPEVQATIGDVATAILMYCDTASLVVVQSAETQVVGTYPIGQNTP